MKFRNYIIRYLKPKFNKTFKINKNPQKILDIGIANNSYFECKSIFPNSIYSGIDLINNTELMNPGDNFICGNLDDIDFLNGLTGKYDLIICNHVFEHLKNGILVYIKLLHLLTKDGVLFIEFPNIMTAYKIKSVGSYHFHDDSTHKQFYSLIEMANIAMDHNCKIISCGPSSTYLKNLIALPRSLIGFILLRNWQSYLLHLTGKVDHILVKKTEIFSHNN